MPNATILAPVFAMVILTAIVWILFFISRFKEMKTKKIHPQQIANSRQAAETLTNTKAADNFKNLFEVPVLFYVASVLIFVTQTTTTLIICLCWLFVVFRAVHSFIHCTSNNVKRRAAAYLASTLIIGLIWLVFGVELLMRN